MPKHASYIKNLSAELEAVAAAHPGKLIQLWCEDEAREGQKGRTGHRWFTRGERPPGRCAKRFLSTYILATLSPGSHDPLALVLPHAVLLLDQAGWHGKAALHVPENVTLLPLAAYSPELNPVERVWLYLRERFLSFRLHQSEAAIVDALCTAWNALRAETGRLTTLTSYPWIMHALDQVSS